jgi:murein L,D-transpeptidase YcbB/YkuD
MWEELSMSRRLLAVLGVLTTAFVLAARADERPPVKIVPKSKGDIKRGGDKADPKVKIGDAANLQEALKRRFDDFKQQLLTLALRMENSPKAEDREKAKVLRLALKKASEEGVETQFSSLVEMLRGNGTDQDTEKLQGILRENEKLRENLRAIMELLLKDDRDAQLRREREAAQKLLEELKTVIRKQELVENRTIQNRTKNDDLAKSQRNVKDQTHGLTNPKSNQGSEAKQGEGKGSKSGKQGVGEAKNDTKDPNANSPSQGGFT